MNTYRIDYTTGAGLNMTRKRGQVVETIEAARESYTKVVATGTENIFVNIRRDGSKRFMPATPAEKTQITN